MEEEIDIKELIFALWRKKLIIAIVTVVFLGIGILLYGRKNDTQDETKLQDEISIENIEGTYVQTDFIFERGESKELDGITTTFKQDITKSVITNLNTFAKSQNFLKSILGDDIDLKEFQKSIMVYYNGYGDVMNLIVVNNDKELAIKISNEILKEFTDKIYYLYKIKELTIVDGPKELDEDEVKILNENIKENLETSEDEESKKEETKKSGGSKKKVVLVTAVGFVLACGVIVVMELFSSSVKSEEQLEKVSNLKSLVRIPKTLDASSKFKLLRVNLNNYKTILVTSSENGSGKSFVSMNLAKAFARYEKKTLLVDVEYLLNKKIDKNEKESDVKNLTMLLSKDGTSSNSEVAESVIEEKIKQLENIYDVIIIDSKNILEDASTLAVARVIKNIVMVVAERKTKLEDIIRAKNNVEDIGGNVIGTVLNFTYKKSK